MNQINLVPIEYKKRYRRKWYILLGAVGGAVTCMVLITLALIPTFQIAAAEKEQERIAAELSTKEIVETKAVLAQIDEAHQRNDKAGKLLVELGDPTHITRQTMDTVVGNVPKGLRMNAVTMEHKDHTILIEGHARSITKVAQYVVQLYNTGQFDIIEYESKPNEGKDLIGWMDYNIKIKPNNLLTEAEEASLKAAQDAAPAQAEEAVETEPKKDAGGDELL